VTLVIAEAEPRPGLVGDDPARRGYRGRGLVSALLVLLVAVGLTGPAWGVNHDLPGDAAALLTWVARPFAAVAWPIIPVLLVACVLHYLAAAGAARAAAGVHLPIGELVASQFAASAANRLTPAGLGGATVNGRFFHRRGFLSPGSAAAAVSALGALGAAADLIGFAAVLAVGTATGLPGVRGEVPLLLHKISGLLLIPAGVWWILPAAAVSIAAVTCVPSVRRAVHTRRTRTLHGFGTTLVLLLRRPARVTALMSCSAATTLMLAVGFAAAATLSHADIAPSSFCALMIGYMAASAAGNAVPTPGGIGTADAALVGVLAVSGSSLAHAVPIVIAFRLVTFWLPAVVGLALARPLRRRGAL
jgi:uncharacterized membrane protein YbhN (UPF0104 family)